MLRIGRRKEVRRILDPGAYLTEDVEKDVEVWFNVEDVEEDEDVWLYYEKDVEVWTSEEE